jgi:arylsulfatase A-like enzyme
MRRVGVVFLTAWWCALALSAIHLLLVAYRYHVLGQIVWHGREILWMAPLGNLLLFSAVALPTAAIAMRMSPVATRRLSVGVFGGLAVLGMLLLFPSIHLVASFILAAGLGLRMASLNHRIWLGRPWQMAGVGLGAAIGAVVLLQGVRERAAFKRERGAAIRSEGTPPNVLLLVWDTARAISMSLYGYARPTTPALERWSQDGVVFDWAFAPAPWTLPSHASVMTGVDAGDQTGDWRSPLDGRQRTLAEVFAARGFATAGFVGNLNYTHTFSGLRRGFVTYDEHRRSALQVIFSTPFLQPVLVRRVLRSHSPPLLARLLEGMSLRVEPPYWAVDQKLDGSVSNAFLDWQRGVGRRPFFAFLNYFNAHQYWAPDEFATRFGPDTSLVAQYDRAIAYLDAEVQRVLDSLRVRGVLDNTLVILTSDHGELLGEHGLYDHGKSLYLPVLQVPLVLRYPRALPAGVRSDHVVSLRDLAPAILSIAFPGDTPALTGRSLLRHLSISPADSVHVALAEVSKGINTAPDAPVSKGDMISFVDATHHYIRNGDGTEELYAYREDPDELHNLAGTPGAVGIVAAFRKHVDDVRSRRAAVRPGLPRERP